MIALELEGRKVGALRIRVDGVVLNPGLPDEPLPKVLSALGEGLVALSRGKGAQALELPRARMLWLLEARDDEVKLRWVPLAGSTAASREARLDLRELGVAVAEHLPKSAAGQRLGKQLRNLRAAPAPPPALDGFALRGDAAPLSLRVTVEGLPALHGTPWASLLAPGEVELHDARGTVATLAGPPLLALERLVDWAQRSLSPSRRAPPFAWTRGGTLSVTGSDLRLGRHTWPGLARPLGAAIGGLGSELVAGLTSRIPALARHPALRGLASEARALAALASQVPLRATPGLAKPRPPRRRRPSPPVTRGSVRKLSFERLVEVRLPFAPRQLRIVGERVLALGHGDAALVAVSDGALLWRRRVRAAVLGQKVLAVDSRDHLLRLDLATGQPRWFRDSEGIDLVGLLPGAPGQVVLVEPDALSGRYAETGLAAWHFRPPMGERVFAAHAPDRLFVATAGGQLASLDLATGEPHFRAIAPRPFRQVPLLVGDALLVVLEGQPGDDLLVIDPATGEVRTTVPLGVRDTGPLLALGPLAAALGRTGEGWALVIVDPAARTRRAVATGVTSARAPALAGSEWGFLVCAPDGRARLFDVNGAVRFSEDEPSGRATHALAPILERRLALIGSERPALYDLSAGRRLARLPEQGGICAIDADQALRVVTGDDGGMLRGYRLRGHLAVVDAPGAQRTR